MFRGLTAITIDVKGRMAIPARYRDALAAAEPGAVVVTIDTEQRCLLLYPRAAWETIEAKLSGRILLPGLLREYAGLGADMMLVGQGLKFEIWGATAWETAREAWLLEEQDKDTALLSSELLELSI
jgi:MraZ protein